MTPARQRDVIDAATRLAERPGADAVATLEHAPLADGAVVTVTVRAYVPFTGADPYAIAGAVLQHPPATPAKEGHRMPARIPVLGFPDVTIETEDDLVTLTLAGYGVSVNTALNLDEARAVRKALKAAIREAEAY